MTDQFPTGWIDDKPAVQAYLSARAAAGDPAVIGEARPDLKGYWRRLVESGITHVLLYQAEESLHGKFRKAIMQQRGTCVEQGTFRAIEDGYWDAIDQRKIVAKPEQVVSETIYAGGRVNVGKGRLGPSHPWGCNCRRCPDGLVGAWAAQYVHDYGIIPRGVYGGIDLSQPREPLSIEWAAPNRGVPRELIEASAPYKCDAYHVSSANDLADVTAARYCSAICSTHRQGSRDSNGEATYTGQTAHCEAIVGVYMRYTWDGNPNTIYDNTGFVDQQSWGNQPIGPDTLNMYKRQTAKLREGAYGTPMQAMRSRIVTGETWAFRLRDGFRAGSLVEAVK